MAAIIVLYILLPIIQIFFYLSNNFTFDIIEKVNFIASIASLHWMLSNIMIASKVPFFQNIIPYDKRIKTHILFSTCTIFFVIYHGVYKFLIGYSIGLTTIPLAILFFLFLFISILWIPVPGFTKIKDKIKLPFSNVLKNYEFNKRFHIISQPILGGLLFIHIYYSGLFYEVPIISSLIYYVLFIVSYSMFFLSKTNIFKRKCRVKSVDVINDIVVLDLQLNKPINYKSGQFTFLGYKNSKGGKEEHPFSFLSIGEEKSNSVSFGIKILGDFTDSLTNIKIDDNLWIRGTYGNFIPKKRSLKPIILIGSGIGIVPLISIVKDLYISKSKRSINLIIAVNRKEEILNFETLKKADRDMDNLNINYLIYEEDGLLFSTDYFKSKIDEPKKAEYYICSSPGVRNIIVKSLQSLAVKKTNINYEAFSF